jgi:hypothetical protein
MTIAKRSQHFREDADNLSCDPDGVEGNILTDYAIEL